MDILSPFKITKKTFINPAGWFGYHTFKQFNFIIWQSLTNLLHITKPARQETFKQAAARLGLTQAILVLMEKRYRQYAFGFATLGLLATSYTLFLLLHHGIMSALLSMAVVTLLFTQAYRYDLWALQIKRRELGMTFTEWRQHRLLTRRVVP